MDKSRRPNSRIITHVPLKGKKINLDDYGIQWYEKIIMPDIDLLAVKKVEEQQFKA
jgi:hypothetical protein